MDTQEILSANERSDAAPQPKYEGGRTRLSGQKQADECAPNFQPCTMHQQPSPSNAVNRAPS